MMASMRHCGWTGPRNNSSTAFVWSCWRGYTKLPVIQRVTAADFRITVPLPIQEAAE